MKDFVKINKKKFIHYCKQQGFLFEKICKRYRTSLWFYFPIGLYKESSRLETGRDKKNSRWTILKETIINIYASQPYEDEGHYYDYFQLKFYCDKYVWLFIRSGNDKPKGYLLSEDRELINGGLRRYYINFDPADLEGEYIGDICIDTI